MGEVKVTTKTRRAPGAKREIKKGPDSARIAVVGIPASGKTTYFRFLAGHFGLNLPILYVPARVDGGQLPIFGDLENDVALEETTYETTDPTDPEGSLETTSRFYVNRPMEDRKKLWVELAAGREEQGVLTKYPLPTKFNQFVEMKMRFRYGAPDGETGSKPMELQTIDEAGGIIADYFTYDRLWIDSDTAEVTEKSCRVIPHFDAWRPDRRDLWQPGPHAARTLRERRRRDHPAPVARPPLAARPGPADQPRPGRLPLRPLEEQPPAGHRDLEGRQTEGVLHRGRAVRPGAHVPEHVRPGRLPAPPRRRRAWEPSSWPRKDAGSRRRRTSSWSPVRSRPGEATRCFIGESGEEAPSVGTPTMGVPVMVNTTLPLARACEKVLQRRATKGA